ncbi:unnamed protein product [Adineta steineri]|uniref:Uncharacterized protein n=1 Tax=Adineta steineri TaxID=433720 RepID=A0A814QNE2_9BILA|nr:unnamed protein product [Adineta steineri]
MLSRALRLLDVDILIRMGFFIRDIHRHIQQLHSEQIKTTDSNKSFTVYRGQGLSIADVEKMIKAKNGLISFNNFLSTSKSRSNALRFALEAAKNPDLVGILFIMDIDSSHSSTYFASITDVSYQHDENDILFSMHTIFRIVDIKSMDEHNRRYEIKLTLTSDNDIDLTLLTNRIRDETYSNSTGWHKLAEILLKMGEYTKVENIYKMLYDETTDESKKAYIYHQLGFTKDEQGTYQEAVVYYEKSINIKEKILPSNHLSLATSYNNIGQTFYHMADYSKALLFFEKALEIRLQALPENHSGITDCYQNIGLVHYNMGDYMKALSCIEKALEVQKTSLLHNHPDLAYYYNNIGRIAFEESKQFLISNKNEISRVTSRHIWPPNHKLLLGCLINAYIVSRTDKEQENTNKNYCLITQLGNYPTHVKFVRGSYSLREEIFERFKHPFQTNFEPSQKQIDLFIENSQTLTIQQFCHYITTQQWHDLDNEFSGVLVDFIIVGETFLFN